MSTTQQNQPRERKPNKIEKVWKAYEGVLEQAAATSGHYTSPLAVEINYMHRLRSRICIYSHGDHLEMQLLIVMRQQGRLTKDGWDHLMANFTPGTTEWRQQLDSLHFEFFGRELKRRAIGQVRRDIHALEALDSNPYLGDKGQEMMWIFNQKHQGTQRVCDHAQPGWEPKRSAGDIAPAQRDEEQDDSLLSQLKAWGARRNEELGGRYGYLPSTREGAEPAKSQRKEDVNPEWIDHADQVSINTAFYALMKGISL